MIIPIPDTAPRCYSVATFFSASSVVAKAQAAALSAVLVVAGALVPLQVQAAPVDTLMELMRFDDIVSVMADEGRSLADDLAGEGLGVPQFAWENMLEQLYDVAEMTDAFRGELGEALSRADVGEMIAFYETDLGSRIADLEVDARIALADDAVLEAASESWAALAPDDARAVLIDAFVESNDLIEMNVISALNSDIAYLSGLASTLAGQAMISEADIMRDVWAREGEVRADVSEWVYGFSTLAYEPLSDDELSTYVAFSESEAGQALNFALFAAFDKVYADLSRGLGAGTGVLMQTYEGEDI